MVPVSNMVSIYHPEGLTEEAGRVWVRKHLELRLDVYNPVLRNLQARIDAVEGWYGKKYSQAREELLEGSRK